VQDKELEGPETDNVILPAMPLKPSTPIAYLVPATALKVTLLVKVPPEGESSFAAIEVKAVTGEPLKIPRTVSKLLPRVETVTLPEADAVQNHHTEAPPALPAIGGSPNSLVAPTLDPATVADEPLIRVALAKLSFTGAAWRDEARFKPPSKVKSHRKTQRVLQRCREDLVKKREQMLIIR